MFIQAEHAKYGQENIHIAPPTDDGSKQHRVGNSVQPGDHVTQQYALYSNDNRAEQSDSKEEDTTLNSTTSTERRIMKRKILRYICH